MHYEGKILILGKLKVHFYKTQKIKNTQKKLKNSKIRFRTLHIYWDDKKKILRVYRDDLRSTIFKILKIA